jgi:hypothetical protein
MMRSDQIEAALDIARRRYVEVFKPLQANFKAAMQQCTAIVKRDPDSAEAEAARERVRETMRLCSQHPDIVEAGVVLARLEDAQRRLLLGASLDPNEQPPC